MAATAIYEERDCEICASRKDQTDPLTEKRFSVCADCGERIPTEATDYAYKNMGGQGFQSHTSDHRHTKMVGGIVGFGFALRQLCKKCYRLDFEKAYPGADLPI